MSWSPQQEQFGLKSIRGEKECSLCHKIKQIQEFPPDRRALDGRQARCRVCINEWMKIYYRNNPAEQMIRRAKCRSRKEKLEFDLSVEDLLPLPTVCPVFGIPLRLSVELQDPNTYSLDRIDNTKGYVRGNVAVMSYRANRLKNDGTAEEHEAIAAWMRKHMDDTANDHAAITRAAESVTVVL